VAAEVVVVASVAEDKKYSIRKFNLNLG